MYFDSHAHLTEDCFAQDFDTIVENMKAASVTGMMEIGFDLPSSEKAVQLAERFSWVHAAVGSHPDDAAQVDEARIAVYRDICGRDARNAAGLPAGRAAAGLPPADGAGAGALHARRHP